MSSRLLRLVAFAAVPVLLAACAGAAPTPIVIYVTPAPTTAAVAAPTPTPTLPPPAPIATYKPVVTLPPATPEPTPDPTPKPISYTKLTNRQWAKVVKNPDAYDGRGYFLWGCITQFDAATGTESFRAQASNRKEDYWFSDGVNTFFEGDEDRLSDFVEDDLVYMKVISLGSYSYDTQNGGNTTVPLFEVRSISRKGDCS